MFRDLVISKETKNDPSIFKYISDIRGYERLTANEEVELARMAKNGDNAARDRLIKSNLAFVISVAKQYMNMGLELPDLISEGNIGLLEAVNKYDETRGFKFISFAVWYIRKSITDALTTKSRLVRLKTKYKEIEYGESSLDAPISDDSKATFLDMMQGDLDTDTFSEKEHNAFLARECLSTLPNREREIMSRLFGIGRQKEEVYELAQEYGVTEERIKQICRTSINKMKLLKKVV